MKKKLILLIVLLISFCINIDGVKANQTTCTWRLPYTGVMDEDGRIVFAGKDSRDKEKSDPASGEMYIVSYSSSSKKSKAFNFVTWYGESGTFSDDNLKGQIDGNGKCPEYISFKNNGFGKRNVDKTGSSHLLKVKTCALCNGSSSPFVYISDKKGGNHVIYLPLYSQNGEVKNEPIKEYQKQALDAWTYLINKVSKENETACGSDFEKFLDKDNFTDKSDFLSYALGGYGANSFSKFDSNKNISETCWEIRQTELYSRYYSAKLYIDSLDSVFIANSDFNKYSTVKRFAYLPIEGSGKLDDEIKEEKRETTAAKNADETAERLDNNKCLALCQTSAVTNQTAVTECQKGTPYKNCYEALTKCKEDNASDDDIDNCLKGKLGEEEFNSLNEKADTLKKSLDRYSLTKVTVPELNIKFKPYKVKCEDVEFLHVFWVILSIAAPILAIVFGTVDFLMAVVASDEKKMQTARKKFPKRLISALLLFLAFSLVSILVSFSDNKNVNSDSLIKCIVNG